MREFKMRYSKILSYILIILILLSYISVNIPAKVEAEVEMGDVNQPLWDNAVRLEYSVFAGEEPYNADYLAKPEFINHPYQNAISDNEVPRIITDVSQLYTRTLLLEDYNEKHPNYRIYLKFYRWWPATCYHVAHDEWRLYTFRIKPCKV